MKCLLIPSHLNDNMTPQAHSSLGKRHKTPGIFTAHVGMVSRSFSKTKSLIQSARTLSGAKSVRKKIVLKASYALRSSQTQPKTGSCPRSI
jgi:hypothetical protein